MNFNQIVGEARKLCKKENQSAVFIFDMAVDEFKKQANRVYMPGWEALDFVKSSIPDFYDNFGSVLQLEGGIQLTGNDDFDKKLWDVLTKILVVLREVLIQNFQIDLPEARVISMVDEMIERGLLKEERGVDGQRYVSLNENIYDINIKIIKKPDGPAPEEIRQKWIGLILPARKLSNTGIEGYEECYRVPMGEGTKALEQVSPEGAAWFIDNNFATFLFRLDEAEVVLKKEAPGQ